LAKIWSADQPGTWPFKNWLFTFGKNGSIGSGMSSIPDIAERESQAIQELCRQIADGVRAAGDCPCCLSAVQVSLSIQEIAVTCPTGCFRFTYRRDPHTGDFVSGLLDFPERDQPRA
jgi:hypothetical protein